MRIRTSSAIAPKRHSRPGYSSGLCSLFLSAFPPLPILPLSLQLIDREPTPWQWRTWSIPKVRRGGCRYRTDCIVYAAARTTQNTHASTTETPKGSCMLMCLTFKGIVDQALCVVSVQMQTCGVRGIHADCCRVWCCVVHGPAVVSASRIIDGVRAFTPAFHLGITPHSISV